MLKAHLFTYNECSKVKFGLGYSVNSIVLLHSQFYKTFRESQAHIPAQVVIRAEQEVLSAYRSAKSSKHKLTAPIVKKRLAMRLDKRLFSHKANIFSVISLGPRIKCQPFIYPKLQNLMSKYHFCDPLLFVRGQDVWVALTFDIPELLPTNKLALGVDLGCNNIAATSDGKLYKDKSFNARKRQLRFLKRRLQSKGTKSARRHLKKLRNKERHTNLNFTHHLANAILKTSADTIVLEDLAGLKAKKHPRQNKNRISQIPFYQLKQILTYKALLHNKQVITVSPAYTSQIDHRTNKKDGKRIGGRYYGTDGQTLHADVNAACNIALRSKLPCSIQNYYAWQARVTAPIVCQSLSQDKALQAPEFIRG